MHKVVFIFLFLFLNISITIADEKIAFLNVDFLIQNTNYGKSTVKEIENLKIKDLEKFLEKEKKIRSQEDELIKKKNILSQEEFEKKVREITLIMEGFNKEKKESKISFEKKKKELLNGFFKKTRPLIEKYISENNITAVFNKNHIFIANKKYDITADLIKVINAQIK